MTTRVMFLAFMAAKLYWNVRPSVDGVLVNIVLWGERGVKEI